MSEVPLCFVTPRIRHTYDSHGAILAVSLAIIWVQVLDLFSVFPPRSSSTSATSAARSRVQGYLAHRKQPRPEQILSLACRLTCFTVFKVFPCRSAAKDPRKALRVGISQVNIL